MYDVSFYLNMFNRKEVGKLNFQDLLNLKVVPVDTFHKLTEEEISKHTITFGTCDALSDIERIYNDRGIICENADWVFASEDYKNVYSGRYEEEVCYRSSNFASTFVTQELEKDDLLGQILVTIKSYQAKNNMIKHQLETQVFKEENTMADMMNSSDLEQKIFNGTDLDPMGGTGNSELDNILDGQDINNFAPASNDFMPSTTNVDFNAGQANTNAFDDGLGEYNDNLTKENSNYTKKETKAFTNFNREFGNLLCFISKGDAALKVSATTKKAKDADGNLMPKATGEIPKDVLEQFAKKSKGIDKKWCLLETKLEVKQAKPSAAVGAIVGQPIGGLAGFEEFEGLGELKPGDDTTVKYKLLPIDFFYTVAQVFFASQIKENDLVSTDPVTFQVDTKQTFKEDKNTGRKVPFKKSSIKVINGERKSVMTPQNVFPISVNRTIDATQGLTPDQCKLLNQSVLQHIFKITSGQKTSKWDLLTPEDKAMLNEDKQSREITSRFFTTGTDKVVPTVHPFHDSKATLSALNFPVKKQVKKAGTENDMIWKPDKISCLDPEVEKNDKDRALSSLHSDRFKTIRELAGDVLNVDDLQELVRTKRKTKAGKNAFDARAQQRAALEALKNENVTALNTNIDTMEEVKNYFSEAGKERR